MIEIDIVKDIVDFDSSMESVDTNNFMWIEKQGLA